MSYWRWPYAADVPTTPGGSSTEFHFYDWNLMPDSLNNSTPMNEVDMVASFLKDCGYMADMDYGIESGTTDNKALNALISFGYSQYTMQKRDKLTTFNWADKIRSNLNDGFPVYYSGMTKFIGGSGHAFVVDGYDSDGLFHVNFGWGKVNPNTYYNLETIPAGGGEFFNHHESAILGIVPFTICDSRHLYNLSAVPSYFCYSIGGELTISSSLIHNVSQGEFSSPTQIRLTSGVTIQKGSNVRLCIRDVPHCSTDTESLLGEDVPMKRINSFGDSNKYNHTKPSIYPNPVNDILYIRLSENPHLVKIYNLNGQCLLQTAETEINVSVLPAGLYLLTAQTSSGEVLQTKFIKL